MATYYNPVKIYFGPGELKNLSTIMQPSVGQGRKILLLTGSRSLRKSGRLEEITGLIQGHDYFLYDQIPSDPDVEDICTIKQKTDPFKYDSILAVGGGSVIDAGKCLSALRGLVIQSPEEIRKVIEEKSYQDSSHKCPILAVPTTAGTGSEVTSWATVWDKEKNLKYSIEGLHLYPEIALVDPELTVNLPAGMTASSALDAVSHALEAYWSKNTNEIVRMYALKSIENIVKNLEALLKNLEDIHLRSRVAYGSLFAGLAFSNTKTTACHSISYPLTLMFGLNHGVAVSLTLGKMLKKNESSLVNREDLLAAFGASHAEEVEVFIRNILNRGGIGDRLKDHGVSRGDLAEIADRSYTPGRMDNNPVVLDRDSIIEILDSIY